MTARIAGGFAAAILAAAIAMPLGCGLPADPAATLFPLVASLCAMFCAGALGRSVLERLLGRGEAAPEEVFLAGLIAISLGVFILGFLGLLSVPAVLVLFLPGLLLVRIRRDVPRMREAMESAQRLFADCDHEERLLVVVAAAALGWAAQLAAAPPTGMDALTYHLALPAQYLLRGTFNLGEGPAYDLYWHHFGLVVLPWIALDPTGRAANFLGFGILLVLAGAAARIAGRMGGRRAALIALAACAASPLAHVILQHTKDDLLAASCLAAGTLSWFIAEERGSTSPRRIAWGCLLLGAALAVKPTSVLLAGPLAAMKAWEIRREGRRALLPIFALAFLPALWALRGTVLAGTPLPPIVGSDYGAVRESWASLFVLRARHLAVSFMEAIPENIDGPSGAALLMGVCAAAFGAKETRTGRRIAVSGFAAILLWFPLGRGQARFLLPALMVLALPGFAAIARSSRFVRAAMLACILVSLGASVSLTQRVSSPLMLHAGSLGEDLYLEQHLNSYRVQSVGSRLLPPGARVLAVGETRLFPFRRVVAFDGYWERGRLLDRVHDDHDPAALGAWLAERGFTHVLYNEMPINLAHLQEGRVPPLCARDTETLRSFLESDTYCRAIARETAAGLVGLYEIR